MNAALAIAARDFRSLFLTPLGWTLLAIVQLIVGIVFVVQLQVFLDPPKVAALSASWGLTRVVAAPLFNWAAFLLLLVVPFLTMRALSDEHRTNAIALLLAAPISATSIVAGKFVALTGYLAIQVALITLLPMLLLLGGSLDLGLLAAQALGLFLLACTFTAFGLWMSSLSRQPAVSAIATFGVLLVTWILSWRGPGDRSDNLAEWIHYLSWQIHLDGFLRGLVDSADVSYFVIFIFVSLWCCRYRIAGLRRGR